MGRKGVALPSPGDAPRLSTFASPRPSKANDERFEDKTEPRFRGRPNLSATRHLGVRTHVRLYGKEEKDDQPTKKSTREGFGVFKEIGEPGRAKPQNGDKDT